MIIFLIGGTGNQFFQLGRYGVTSVLYCDIFLKPFFSRIMGFTLHERFFDNNEYYTRFSYFHTLILFFDLLLFKVIKKTLFTQLNINFGKSSPLIKLFYVLDYCVGIQPSHDLSFLFDSLNNTLSNKCILHIRGGDLIRSKTALAKYGKLTLDYYRSALDKLTTEELNKVYVYTDDPEYAQTLLNDYELLEYEIVSVSLKDTIKDILLCEYFISSNSTLSFWLVNLRKDKYSIVPEPFWLTKDFKFSDNVEIVPVSYPNI